MSNLTAPKGKVFVCCACGKRSRDRYGDQPLTRGWDVSCMMNAHLYEEWRLTLDENGTVTRIFEGGTP